MPKNLMRRAATPLGAALLTTSTLAVAAPAAQHAPHAQPVPPVIRHHTVKIDGVEVFYREAGPASAPVVLLLHGFPTSSHMSVA